MPRKHRDPEPDPPLGAEDLVPGGMRTPYPRVRCDDRKIREEKRVSDFIDAIQVRAISFGWNISRNQARRVMNVMIDRIEGMRTADDVRLVNDSRFKKFVDAALFGTRLPT